MSRFAAEDLDCVRGERRVFVGLRFQLEPGEALILSGANGSGKSSLLKLLAGLLGPARGRISWDGGSVADDPDAHRQRLNYLGHLDAVKPLLTVAENLRFWLAFKGAGGDIGAALARALDAFSIAHLAEAPVRFLSAGQKRRLSLARVVALPAELWLLDEPATSLDGAAVGMLERAVARHRERGGIAVVATHTPLDLAGAQGLDLTRFQASRAGEDRARAAGAGTAP